MAGPDDFIMIFQYKLCLNHCAVPVETKHMPLLDPLNLAERYSLNLPESTDVNLVSFKATGDMFWLSSALKLPCAVPCKARWWAHNSVRVPLLLEIKEAIRILKQKKKANQPKDPKCLILLEIRGQLLYVKNSSMSVTLGLIKEPGLLNGDHPDYGPLVWFCQQLQKDIDEHLVPKPAKKAPAVPAECKEQVEEVLDQLRAHAQCLLVHFIPTRMIFQIRKKSGASQDLYVLGLNKWRKTQGGSQASQDPFQRCLSKGLSFLDAPDDDPDAPAGPAPAAPDEDPAGPAGGAFWSC